MSMPLIVSVLEERPLAILPCCETEGAFWGRSVTGYEWAECMTCGHDYPGLMATENEQRKLYAKIDKRNAAKAA
jgi:hypothetical protein